MRSLTCGLLFVGILLGMEIPCRAESLSQSLQREDPIALARAAREKGSAVRGAILFAQKSLNCAACHASASTDRLGPDLTQVAKTVPDVHFVESILKPSQKIEPAFQSTKILTVDGRVITGRILSRDENTIVLREAADPQRRITLMTDEVEQATPSPLSAMPADLADQLKDRQQFLDLVRYLMEIAATGNAGSSVNTTSIPGTVDQRLQGLALLDQFGCVRCHALDVEWPFPNHRGPDLTAATGRIERDYLRRFLISPHDVKPDTSMPHVMGHLPDREQEQAVDAIVHYLASRANQPLQRSPVDGEAAARGNELFHTVGCVACHSPRDANQQETLPGDSVPLGEMAGKYSLVGLTAFLEDPHAVRPSGRMPNMKLTHWEAVDIANYLLAGAVGEVPESVPTFSDDAALVSLGKQYYQQLGCVRCHEEQPTKTTPPIDLVALRDADVSKGCLSNESGRWPRYALDEEQRAAIVTALQSTAEKEMSETDRVTLTMQTFRCFNCHQRDDLGGISEARNAYFHTTDPNLGPQGRIPPTLTGVGAKLKPKWLREVLVQGRSIRPYMKTRMPQFGNENVAPLVESFQRLDPQTEVSFGHFDDVKEAAKIGTELVGNQGLNCIACHSFQQKPAQTMSAVDLTEMAERLHKGWFYEYLRAPQSLSPNTVMPTFWPGGNAFRKDILEGKTDQQIEAIWAYLLDGRQARTPRGLIQEPIELLATDEAVMLRRNYQGIGKRGIGVGFPGGLNLAYDAEQMRIGMLWKGDFADPGAAWRGQGAGTVRPLGRPVLQLPRGPEFDHQQTPWIVDEGRPPEHQFKGYTLDEHRQPTFLYRFGDCDVQDELHEVQDAKKQAPILRRRLVFSTQTPQSDLRFRVGSDRQIARASEGRFQVGDALWITIVSDHQAKIVETTDGKELLIPLDLPRGNTELVLHYEW